MSTLPDYFNPSHFRVGQPVMYGEFCGTVSCYYGDGMWDVRLPGGPACVSGSDIKDAEANQQQESDMGTYVLRDGTEVTREQIASAYAEGKARLCHGRRNNGTSTSLMLDGVDYDTRGGCFSVWDEVWTTRPQTIGQAIAAAA